MIEISDRREIAAPPEVVWRITADVETWPDWTPTVSKAEGLQSDAFGLGSRYRLTQPLQPSAIWQVVEHEPGRSFVWIREGGRMRLRAGHLVEPKANGTRSTLSFTCDGPGVRLLAPVLRPIFAYALRTENRALAELSEARAQDGSPLGPGMPNEGETRT